MRTEYDTVESFIQPGQLDTEKSRENNYLRVSFRLFKLVLYMIQMISLQIKTKKFTNTQSLQHAPQSHLNKLIIREEE